MATNLQVSWINKADSGTLTGTAPITLAPLTRLQNKHVLRKTRWNATSAYIVCDLGSSQSLDVVALMGMSGDAPTLRVRVSTADSSGVSGDAYDSGSLTDAWDSDYLPFVRLISSPVTGRYVRIDISENGVEYIDAGRLFIGLRSTFGMNFKPGWSRTWIDPTRRTKGRSGQSFDDLRDKYRQLNLTFESISEDNRWDITEAVDIALGQSGDMLVIVDPESTNISRDSVWGYLETLDPVIEPVVVSGGPRFSRTYQICERL